MKTKPVSYGVDFTYTVDKGEKSDKGEKAEVKKEEKK